MGDSSCIGYCMYSDGGKSGGILLATILLSPILLVIGTISMVCAGSDKRYVKSILDKIESDISNKDFVTRKIMYGDKNYSAPFTYGMILEITYLRKSRVIDRINIVQ